MRIAIIGAGSVGTTLGAKWANAGHQIVYGSRRGEGAPPHQGSSTTSIAAAVASSDLAVLATPWAGVGEALSAAGDFGGKPLLDVTNPLGAGFTLLHGHTTSGAEVVASLARNARVVKAFNSTGLENMADPAYPQGRLMMPVAGDDAGAVKVAMQLAQALGFEPIGLPGLARARELEPLALLWIKLAYEIKLGRNIGFVIGRRSSAEAPTPVRAAAPLRLTVVGSGSIGGALARAWLRAGHSVTIAARDAQTEECRSLAAAGARIAAVDGAASGADAVVFATPASAVVPAAQRLGSLERKIVVDCTNAISKGFALELGLSTSSAEALAQQLPGARVVRSFNQQGAETLANPRFGSLTATNFVAGDDPAAVARVNGLAADAGLHSVGVGALSSSRVLEPLTLFWVSLARQLGTREFCLTLAQR